MILSLKCLDRRLCHRSKILGRLIIIHKSQIHQPLLQACHNGMFHAISKIFRNGILVQNRKVRQYRHRLFSNCQDLYRLGAFLSLQFDREGRGLRCRCLLLRTILFSAASQNRCDRRSQEYFMYERCVPSCFFIHKRDSFPFVESGLF